MLKPISVVCAVASILSSPLQAAESPAPLRALLVVGGCCHDYDNQKGILTNGISRRTPVQWTVVHEGSTRDHELSIYTNANWAAGYDVVIHSECFGSVTNNALIERITAAHQAGLPAVILHCSVHSYRAASTDEWRKLIGISSYSHEKLADLQVVNVRPEHPVMKGFPKQWPDAADELYKVSTLWPNVIPLAQAYGVETKTNHTVIWVNTYGKGRVFGTSLGHGNETVGSDVYLDLVTRGMLWACGRLEEKTSKER